MKRIAQATVTVIVALALLFAAAYATAWYGGRGVVQTPVERTQP